MMNLVPMNRGAVTNPASGNAISSIINYGNPTTSAPGRTTASVPSTVPSSNAQANGSTVPGSAQTYGPATSAGPQYSEPGNFDPRGFDINEVASGAPGYDNVMYAANALRDPTASNYVIGGMNQYQTNMSGIAGQYGALAGNALSMASGQVDKSSAQNAAYQGNVNSSTQDFLNNASGMGVYNNNGAAQGSDQQNAAYNAITNMAQGNGPSLAAKNLQAGLNQQNQAVQAQSMSNQGLGGAGNATRNALNAQAANTNNYLQSAQQASTAEQLGALSQQSAAANNIRASNEAQASAAASAGATLRGQNQAQLGTQYGAQLAGNTLQNSTNQAAMSYLTNAQGNAISGQAGAYNNQFNADAQQTNNNMAYDASAQNAAQVEAEYRLQAVQSQAQSEHGTASAIGNIGAAAGGAVAGDSSDGDDENALTSTSYGGSDQNMKTDIDQGSDVNSGLQAILNMSNSKKADTGSSGLGPSASGSGGSGFVGDAADVAKLLGFLFL